MSGRGKLSPWPIFMLSPLRHPSSFHFCLLTRLGILLSKQSQPLHMLLLNGSDRPSQPLFQSSLPSCRCHCRQGTGIPTADASLCNTSHPSFPWCVLQAACRNQVSKRLCFEKRRKFFNKCSDVPRCRRSGCHLHVGPLPISDHTE